MSQEASILERLPSHLRTEFEQMAAGMSGRHLIMDGNPTELDHESAISYMSELLDRNGIDPEGDQAEAAIESLKQVLDL